MFESQEQMEAMAQEAKRRLEQQIEENVQNISSNEEDLYAEFRKYEEGADDGLNGYMNQDGESQEVDVYYGPNPELNNEVEYKEVPFLNSYDEPLFPGGPGKMQVQAWKKEWDGYDIYVTEILNEMFVFRTLNRYEYKQLIVLQNLDALQREEVICQTVTLWPENYTWKEMATSKAGIPSKYADIIMEKSGFTNDYAIQVI